jgi:hypothetical protein
MTTRGEAPAALVTVAFANAGDFGAWHDAKCAELGIPYPGYDHEGAPALDAAWTTSAAIPWSVDGYVCVTLPPEVIAADATLKSLEVMTVKLGEDGTPLGEVTVPAPGVPYEQPIPPEWTDDVWGTWTVTR